MTRLPENAQTIGRFPSGELHIIEKSIRRILRASDLRSRALSKQIGLTAPQLVVLKAIAALGEVTTTALSVHADLSTATVITILDKLEQRAIIKRYRSPHDRRIVHARLTEQGMALVANAPEPVGSRFAVRFAALAPDTRREIIVALAAVADMMEAGEAAQPTVGPAEPHAWRAEAAKRN